MMRHHEKMIKEKLKIVQVVRCCNAMNNYSDVLIHRLMKEAWDSECPKNGYSIVKSCLRQKYAAQKIKKILPIPKLCISYRVIKVSIICGTVQRFLSCLFINTFLLLFLLPPRGSFFTLIQAI